MDGEAALLVLEGARRQENELAAHTTGTACRLPTTHASKEANTLSRSTWSGASIVRAQVHRPSQQEP